MLRLGPSELLLVAMIALMLFGKSIREGGDQRFTMRRLYEANKDKEKELAQMERRVRTILLVLGILVVAIAVVRVLTSTLN